MDDTMKRTPPTRREVKVTAWARAWLHCLAILLVAFCLTTDSRGDGRPTLHQEAVDAVLAARGVDPAGMGMLKDELGNSVEYWKAYGKVWGHPEGFEFEFMEAEFQKVFSRAMTDIEKDWYYNTTDITWRIEAGPGSPKNSQGEFKRIGNRAAGNKWEGFFRSAKQQARVARLATLTEKSQIKPMLRENILEGLVGNSRKWWVAKWGNCFVAGTPIAMADGEDKPIEAVQAGDLVLAFDVEQQLPVPARVMRTFVHLNHEPTVLVNGRVRATMDHPFYSNGHWIPAKELTTDDVLLTMRSTTGSTAELVPQKMESIATLAGEQNVYTFEVATYHDYFAGGVLVHNQSMATVPGVAAVPAVARMPKRFPRVRAGVGRVAGGATKGAIGLAAGVAIDWADESVAEAMGMDVEKVKNETLMELFGGIPGHMTIAAGFHAWDDYWYDPDVRDMSGNKKLRSLVTHGHGPDFYGAASKQALELFPGQESRSQFGDVYLSEQQQQFARELSHRAEQMYRTREQLLELQKPSALPWYHRMFAW